MNDNCEEGLRLLQVLEHRVRRWALLDAYEKAVELMPFDPDRLREFQVQAWSAESASLKSRCIFAKHVSHCVVCSRVLLEPGALPSIRAEMDDAEEESAV